MKPLILFLVHLPPPWIGPAAVNEALLSSPGLQTEFSCEVLPVNTSSRMKEINRFSWRKAASAILLAARLVRRMREKRPALVYMTLTPTGIGFLKDLFLVFVVKAFRARLVYHLHGKGVRSRQGVWWRLLYKNCFSATRVILLSESLYPDIQAYVSRSQVAVVPNGVALACPVEEWEKLREERRRPHLFTILFLGNLVRSKGIWTVMEAAFNLKEKGLPFHLCIAGGDFDVSRKDLSLWAKEKGMMREVVFPGFLGGADKAAAFRSADIFVYPTENDTFPLVLLEAMQYGLPVVTTDEGAISDIVDVNQTGFVIPPGDAPALAEKIEFLMQEDAWRWNMGEQARLKFLREYTFEVFDGRMRRLLKEWTSQGIAGEEELCAG
ncbi:MAG TPA: glycosyltransferase family 4 protein [Candidatus Omnitrophota bacterium]|nr:glycosyltransferase family 4 protein [Candidatus Omnitrophota bacterium]HQO58266.1 glycosyltransferase family 4 protein [Candidatus Omnitrophota bacterium]HQP11133.1 glycosyltransferase family 4 protein [Candidatus Omnitrophota bacterium]